MLAKDQDIDTNILNNQEDATRITENYGLLDQAVNTRIGQLNTGIQEDYATTPNLLNTTTNPERVANDLFNSLLEKGVEYPQAQKTVKAWLDANPVKEVDKDLVKALTDERKYLIDNATKRKVKKEEGGYSTTSGTSTPGSRGGYIKLKPDLDLPTQIYRNSGIEKINDAKGVNELYDKVMTDNPGSIKSKIAEFTRNNKDKNLS